MKKDDDLFLEKNYKKYKKEKNQIYNDDYFDYEIDYSAKKNIYKEKNSNKKQKKNKKGNKTRKNSNWSRRYG